MTLSSVSSTAVVFVGSGTRGPFPFSVAGTPIRLTSSSHLKVTRYASATTDTGVLLVEGSDYTVSGLPDAPVIMLTMSQAVLALAERLVAERSQPFAQDLDITVGGSFPADSVEARLDKIVEYVQDLRTLVNRAISRHPLNESSDVLLPPADSGKALGWSGTSLVNLPISGGGYVNATFAALGVDVNYRWNYNPTPLTSFVPVSPGQNYEGFSVELGNFGPRSFSGYGLPTAITGVVAVPAGNNDPPIAHVAGIAGYAATASFKVGAVGVFGWAQSNATNGCVWGGNFLATDQGFQTPLLYGAELNCNVNNPNTNAIGCDVIGGSTEEPPWTWGYRLGALGTFSAPKKRWTWGFDFRDGSAQVAMVLGTQTESANSPSMPIYINWRNAANTPVNAYEVGTLSEGSLVIRQFPGSADKLIKLINYVGSLAAYRDAVTCWSGNVAIGQASTLPTQTLDVWGAVYARSLLHLGVYTVATLPTAASFLGTRSTVIDANSTTFHSVVAGGGANVVPVFYDGTNWRIG